jgi:hypothetical protein
LTDPHVLGQTRSESAIKLPTLFPPLLKKAFGSSVITEEKTLKALSQFERVAQLSSHLPSPLAGWNQIFVSLILPLTFYIPEWIHQGRVSPNNNTHVIILEDSDYFVHPLRREREFIKIFQFSVPVNEEFTLTPTLTIAELGISITRSTKIKIEVAERNVDVLHSKFGMSREEVKKAEKDELNVADSDFMEVSPELIIKDNVID